MTLLLGGCGSSEPAAIRLGESTITKTTVDHWVSVLAGRTVAPHSTGYARYETRAMGFLISAVWLLGASPGGAGIQGHEDGNDPRRTEADRRLEVRVRQAYGQHLAELRSRANAESIRRIVAYYRAHEQSLNPPEARDAEVVRTKSAARADRARRLIEAGVPFPRVAKMISVDAAGKTGGIVPGIVRAQEDGPLRHAVFGAKLHKLTGPIELEAGRYYLFEITRIHRPSHTPLSRIEARMLPRTRVRVLNELTRSWVDGMASETICSNEFVVPGCSEYLGPQAPTPVLSPQG